jgi:phenylacetaldehyde dehydrogenase
MLTHAEEFLQPEVVDGAEIHFSALGVIAVISPWNFPVLLPLRGIIPALLAGNTVICKPSELSPRTAMAFVRAFEGVAPLYLAIGGKEMGAELVRLPVRAIAFTGSTVVGKSIAKEASNSLKRVVLELGGLDAAIVLADADIEVAAREIVRNNARNTGQVCNAIKRVLVHTGIYQQFLATAAEVIEQIVYGDPLDEKTEVGPLVSEVQYERVRSFLDDAISKGAKSISRTIEHQGFLFPQVLLTDVPSSARLLHEEPFGPLLPVIPFSTEAEAITVANETSFGLSASVWTRDSQAARRIAAQLDVGLVRHNTHAAMKSGIPWGGAKESGAGRMKTKEGLREFTNVKVIA